MKYTPISGAALGLFVACCACGAETSLTATAEKPVAPPECAVDFKVVEVSSNPVIRKGDAGTDQASSGFEGGCAFKHKGVYQLFTAEIYGARLVHWTSPDRVKWTKVATIREAMSDAPGMSFRANIWAPMPFYDEKQKFWNLYYVGYRSKPDDSGNWYAAYNGLIVHAVSQTPGPDGLVGPWKDVGIAMEPEYEPWSSNPSQPWEGLQGTDSISPPYEAGGKWVVFYGSAQMQSASKRNPKYPQWGVGLAEAPAPTGPWKRRTSGNPLSFGNFSENPIVTKLTNGSYVLVADSGFIGYASSPDGFRWSRMQNVAIPKDMTVWWDGGTRTPLGCIPEDDGTYTIFFMAHRKASNWQELGYVRVKIEEKVLPVVGVKPEVRTR